MYRWVGLLWLSFISYGQSDAWVYLHDKPSAEYYLAHPEEMLSSRALERRIRHEIALDSTDVPVYTPYLDSIRMSEGISLAGFSKWLNAVHVRGDSMHIAALTRFEFVDSICFASRTTVRRNPDAQLFSGYAPRKIGTGFQARTVSDDSIPYRLHHARRLVEENLSGRNVLIALLDAGYVQADTSRVLQHVYARGGVVDTYNFPDDTVAVYYRHWHGTMVWAVLAGVAPGKLYGPGRGADFCLYISEDVYQEMPVEETWWVMAAERADSVGADIISSSLGYIDFDNHAYDYRPEDLDGKTSFASRGARMAVRKGIHVVVSAGNAGNTSWKKISVPADAEGVIAVGATDKYGQRASFSSTGNTADGRIKPDVMSWGAGVVTWFQGDFMYVNGTSFAAPLIAGFLAEMAEAYPQLTPEEMKSNLLQSSDRYLRPDSLYGYGIPDFSRMYAALGASSEKYADDVIFPNPVQDILRLRASFYPADVQIYDLRGRLLRKERSEGRVFVGDLTPGVYILRMETGNGFKAIKFIKQ